MSDFPPLYAPISLPEPPSLPQYTQCPAEHERVLSEPSSPVMFSLSRTRNCVYETDHLVIDLGRFPTTLAYPTYGYNGVVEGVVRFKKGCTYITQVTVKLEGVITTTATEYSRVAIPSISKVTLTSRESKLVSPNQSNSKGYRCICAGTEYPFSLPFPSNMDGRIAPLPPSFTAVQPAVCVDVSYYIQVEVLRKGIFRRHEVRKIPILYLPKSRPPAVSLLDFPLPSLGALPERVTMVQLTHMWPNTCQSRTLSESAEIPVAHFFQPFPRAYPSGEYIPLGISISCPSSPVLTQLYLSDICVQLVKRRKLWMGSTKQIATRDTTLSTGDLIQRVDSGDGDSYLKCRIKAGVSGREASWKVNGIIDVSYFLRVVLRPRQRYLPTFQHEELVQLTTDSYDLLEVEALEGGLSEPALGLTTLNIPTALSSY